MERSTTFTAEALLDMHNRAQRTLASLLEHCRDLTPEELNRELPEYGDPTVRLQLHHVIGAQRYWIGVLQGRIDADDDNPLFPTVASLEAYREQVDALTRGYLGTAMPEELSNARPMRTWDGQERPLIPAHVIVRTLMHIYHHAGKVGAMCRLMGKPWGGSDYPIL
jgi:uncharacterized damage-inducible protein DinB